METKFKIIGYLFFMLINISNINANTTSMNDSVTFEIENNNVELLSDTLNVTIKITNNSSSSYIFYAFRNIEEGITTIETYCNGNNPAGTAIIIEKQGKQIFPNILFEDDFESPTTKEDVIDTYNQEKQNYLNTQIIVKPDTVERFEIKLVLKDHVFNRGEYDLSLLYFSGKNLKNLVDIDTQNKDIAKYQSKVFNGCLLTNKIKLKVL